MTDEHSVPEDSSVPARDPALHSASLPSVEYPNAGAALAAIARSNSTIRGAVAFVTMAGVEILARILEPLENVRLEVTARAGDATQPKALERLSELGADVDVVIGDGYKRFHPKLWLVEAAGDLTILSGSGNLTGGGLLTNEEQFELLRVRVGTTEAEHQLSRYESLTARALPLDEVRGTWIWDEWLLLLAQEELSRRQTRRREEHLNARKFHPSRTADLQELLVDLKDLYDRTVSAQLRRRDGGRYVPSRFLQGIHRAEKSGDPVPLVTRICRRTTDGYDIIATAGRRDLTVESLVVDGKKPYYDLFSEKTRAVCQERLLQFAPDSQAKALAPRLRRDLFARLSENRPLSAIGSESLFADLEGHATALSEAKASVTLVLGEPDRPLRVVFYDGSSEWAGGGPADRGPVYIDWRSFAKRRSDADNEALARDLAKFPALAPEVARARQKRWMSDIGLGPVLQDDSERTTLATVLVNASS